MGSRKFLHVALLIALGLFQGLAIVSVPAASTILTGSNYQGLSSSEYGWLFLPEIIGAILLSSLGGGYAKTHGIRPVLLLGILTNIFGALFLVGSSAFYSDHLANYSILLAALFFIGLGFGGTLTSLNIAMIRLFPNKAATAITSLHASLGIGTALSPLLLDFALYLDHWWIAPLIISLGFIALFLFFESIKPFYEKSAKNLDESNNSHRFPKALWLFVIAIFLYGFCETVIGNWSPIYLKDIKKLSISNANTALSAFWAFVTIGRIAISILTSWVSFRLFYVLLPLFLIVTFFLIPFIEGDLQNWAIFSLAGLACSGLFPLNVSFGEQSFPDFQSVVSGALMSSYMFGYGVASFGIGELNQLKVISLNFIFYLGAIMAMVMAIINFLNHFIFKRK